MHRGRLTLTFPLLLCRIKLLTGELKPLAGHVSQNGRLRMCVRALLVYVRS